jgi:hypothetical protein
MTEHANSSHILMRVTSRLPAKWLVRLAHHSELWTSPRWDINSPRRSIANGRRKFQLSRSRRRQIRNRGRALLPIACPT